VWFASGLVHLKFCPGVIVTRNVLCHRHRHSSDSNNASQRVSENYCLNARNLCEGSDGERVAKGWRKGQNRPGQPRESGLDRYLWNLTGRVLRAAGRITLPA
jgi:hypothetical protein